MSRDTIDILIDIYEAEMYGDISTDERDFLITEMKSREEYRERKLKKSLNYNKKDKTIEIDGRKVKFEKQKRKNTFIADAQGGPISRKINYTDDLFKLKHPKSAEAVIRHEYGPIKERDHWDAVYFDIVGDAENYCTRTHDEDKIKRVKDILDRTEIPSETNDAPRTVHVLIRKLTDAGVPNLKKYNSEIRDFDKNTVTKTYKKYGVKNRHGRTLEEYHADLHSAAAIGTKAAKNMINDLDKTSRRDAEKRNCSPRDNSVENIARRKVIEKNQKLTADEAMKKRR